MRREDVGDVGLDGIGGFDFNLRAGDNVRIHVGIRVDVDAHVDAHLIEFDVNQDLSARIQPDFTPFRMGSGNIGLTVKFTF